MLHHLALTAASLEASAPFYDRVLSLLGYRRTLAKDTLAVWEGPHPEILLYQARPEQATARHETYDPGIHHVAFSAPSRNVVDTVEQEVRRAGGSVLDAAREYPDYAPGYYAVFFLDPDRIKLEVVHLPSLHGTQ